MRTNESRWNSWRSSQTFSFDLNPKKLTFNRLSRGDYQFYFEDATWRHGLILNHPTCELYNETYDSLKKIFKENSILIEILAMNDDSKTKKIYGDRLVDENQIYFSGYFQYDEEYQPQPSITLYLNLESENGKAEFDLLSEFCLGRIPNDSRVLELLFNFNGFDSVDECQKFFSNKNFRYLIDGYRTSLRGK